MHAVTGFTIATHKQVELSGQWAPVVPVTRDMINPFTKQPIIVKGWERDPRWMAKSGPAIALRVLYPIDGSVLEALPIDEREQLRSAVQGHFLHAGIVGNLYALLGGTNTFELPDWVCEVGEASLFALAPDIVAKLAGLDAIQTERLSERWANEGYFYEHYDCAVPTVAHAILIRLGELARAIDTPAKQMFAVHGPDCRF